MMRGFFAAGYLLGAVALADAPKVTPVVGPCQGGLRPSTACKTCVHCAYCGKTHGRAANSGTCAVCPAGKTGEKAASKAK